MLLFDLTVEFSVGAVFALAHRERLSRSDTLPMRDRALRDGLIYSALLYVASAMFFLVGWPGWNSMYLLDLETEPIRLAWYAYLDSALLCGCYLLGYWVSVAWLRKAGGHTSPVLARVAAVWAGVGLLLFVVLWDRSFTVTSYAEYVTHHYARFAVRWGASDSFFGHALMDWLLVWCVLDFVPLALIYRRARKKAQRAGPGG